MIRQSYRKEFKEILERTILPEGISSDEMKEKLLPLSSEGERGRSAYFLTLG